MYEKFLEIFPASPETKLQIEVQARDYENSLPSDILEFWKEVGFGDQMEGYLKVVNPKEYEDFLEDSFDDPDHSAIAFAITAFGDILVWDVDCIKQLNYRRGQVRVAGTKFTTFVNHRLTKWENISFSMDGGQYKEAAELYGPPAFDECFAYVPALALGGSEKIENIKKVKLREHLLLLSSIVGKLEDQE